MSADYVELARALAGEMALVLGALVVLTTDLAFGKRWKPSRRSGAAAATGALAILGAMYGCIRAGTPNLIVFEGAFILDVVTLFSRLGILVLALLTLGITSNAKFRSPAEFVAIVLFATAGFTLMAAAQNLLIVFLAVELASLSLYVLVGFDKSRPESAEAGLKYFLFGGMSAAFLLFGFSLLFGMSGSTVLFEIGNRLGGLALTPLLTVALVMILVAFGFKAAAAPFHLWAPDVYQGAPTSAAALVASASKLAGITVFTRLLWMVGRDFSGDLASAKGASGWLAVVAVMSAASLLIGNIGALAQTNVRRLLAYSAIAHAGALLLGVMTAKENPAALFYYAATYGFATVGAFGVIAAVEQAGGCQRVEDLAGLHRRSPLLSVCLVVFILSLAGIPPLAGFIGKFVVFAAALRLDGITGVAGWLAISAIFLSAVALYYYLIILKQALVATQRPEHGRIEVPFAVAASLVGAAAAIIVLGVCPSLVLSLF